MNFQQFYLSCLAHASYLIADRGEAVIIDPQRDVQQYLEAAAALGVSIRAVVETHLHADFVSGHRELAARTGAEIVFGRRAEAAFPHRPVSDGDIVRVGGVELRVLETPGHTPESICLVVAENGQLQKIFTGDTLFLADVGRPDLAGGRGFTSEQMASMMYDSLRDKILPLPDDVEVWPAHGAGSACGRNISSDSFSTVGVQRRTNWALQPMTREAFVAALTAGMAAPPPYFPIDAELNRRGPRTLADIEVPPLSAVQVREELNRGVLVLDVRDAAVFGERHIAGAINVGIDGNFASWCGTLLPYDKPLIIHAADDASAAEAVMRLARVGIENAVGYITSTGDLPSSSIPQLTVRDLDDCAVLDVRRRSEYDDVHVGNAQNVPLEELTRRLGEVDRHAPLAVICAGGYRSSIACSLLAHEGFRNVHNVQGGTEEWARMTGGALPT